MEKNIPVGIIGCLMGDNVRFDGGHKRLSFAVDELAEWVSYEPVCPEMAIGLPGPRPALQLVKNTRGDIALRFSQKSDRDLTGAMQHFSTRYVSGLEHLCGFIVCAKSPSCGLERVRIYEEESNNNRKSGTGLLTAELQR